MLQMHPEQGGILVPQKAQFSYFAKGVMEDKYSWKDELGNPTEEWEDICERVVWNVMGALDYGVEDIEYRKVLRFMKERKFLAGGRYLYASGRDLHQTQNCVLLRAEDTREGWGELAYKASMALMTGAGIGVDYSDVRPSGTPISRTGGEASGPISLMKIVNEIGRNVMQGGSRRSAIWAGLNWQHSDIFEFIAVKNWSPEVRALKAVEFNFPATLDMTNVSVLLDDLFFEAYKDEEHELHPHAQTVYWLTVTSMLKTAEPGFSIDVGVNAGETLRNAPVVGGTFVMTRGGYQRVADIVGVPTPLWTGKQWANDVVFEKTASHAPIVRVLMSGGREIRCEPSHEFIVERFQGAGKSHRKLSAVERIKASELVSGDILQFSPPPREISTLPLGLRTEAYTLGFIYGDGSFHVAGGADLTLCTDESKACLTFLSGYKSVNVADGRGHTRLYFSVSDRWRGRSKDQFPEEMYQADEKDMCSFVAGLFDADGNVEMKQKRIRLASKHPAFLRGVARLLEEMGILAHVSKAGTSTFGQSQGYQLVVASGSNAMFATLIPTQRLTYESFYDYDSYRTSYVKVVEISSDGFEDVFCADVKVDDHSFMAEGVIVSNCTEVSSYDDSDICNLGSINLANVTSIEEMEEVVRYATLFLLAGTVYSDLPYDKVHEIREKNRRLGLGLMGIHEWLLKRGYKYGPNTELGEWLDVYKTSTEWAESYANEHELTIPIKTRALAPNGTIGIVAETTTGIEPIFCVAYKRRVRTAQANGNDTTQYQYVVDPTAKRLIDSGVDWLDIEDAYSLSYEVERRIAMQAWVQGYVDHGISSTTNLPAPITAPLRVESFGKMLMKYLPSLRGITVYPDGSRGGQPLTAVLYPEAVGKEGVVFEENEESCVGGICGS